MANPAVSGGIERAGCASPLGSQSHWSLGPLAISALAYISSSERRNCASKNIELSPTISSAALVEPMAPSGKATHTAEVAVSMNSDFPDYRAVSARIPEQLLETWLWRSPHLKPVRGGNQGNN